MSGKPFWRQGRNHGGQVAADRLPQPQPSSEEGVAVEFGHRSVAALGEHARRLFSRKVAYVIVAQDGARPEGVPIGDHEPLRKRADAALEHAHMDVQNEAVYTLGAQKRRTKRNCRRVAGAQDLPHSGTVESAQSKVESQQS